MKKFKLNLYLFLGHSVTVYSDSGFSAAAASPNSAVDEDTDVTLSWTLASGYELDKIEAISGDVEIDLEEKEFVMPDSDVVLSFKSKANNLYKVTEECMASVNDNKVVLHKNTVVHLTRNGVPYDITSEGTSLTVTDAIQNLIDTGVLVKM